MGLFEHFPYTNLHTLNLDWILRKMKELSDKVDNIEDVSDEVGALDDRVSDLEDTVGGFDDRIDELERSDGEQDEAIADHEDRLDDLEDAVAAFHGVPPGGASGQVLAKASAADYALTWVNQSGGGGGGGEDPYTHVKFFLTAGSTDFESTAYGYKRFPNSATKAQNIRAQLSQGQNTCVYKFSLQQMSSLGNGELNRDYTFIVEPYVRIIEAGGPSADLNVYRISAADNSIVKFGYISIDPNQTVYLHIYDTYFPSSYTGWVLLCESEKVEQYSLYNMN